MADGTDPRARERVGSVLDEKWTLEQLLGSGGMGAVYAARHRNGARAAVKILHPELARIAEVRERFLREGYAANRVEHRGVVQVLDDDIVKGGADEGSAYIVMELLEGESLQERVSRSPKLGERELLEVIEAVLDVLAAAHEKGVVHRDLKPENIFLAKDPEREGVRLKVLDFGLARISEASAVTSAGIAVGTPSFMSPEQAAGRSDEIDGRTDVFALGATIFRILTGRRIHEADNMVQVVMLMATVPAPRLRSVVPDVSESFARIVDRALAFERADRYDAVAMRADVRAALEIADQGVATALQVIPFSARNVRVGSLSELGSNDEAKAPRPRAASTGEDAHATDVEDRASEPESYAPSLPRQSTTLPWAGVLVLLAVAAWKFGPSLQEELVRRASLEPVRKLWSFPTDSATAETTSEDETSPDTTADAATTDEGAGATARAHSSRDAGNAPVVRSGTEERDAGVARVIAARPHPTTAPPPPHPTTTAKPPAKKPPAKKPPPQQQQQQQQRRR
jgi:serine/threonine protein kinase